MPGKWGKESWGIRQEVKEIVEWEIEIAQPTLPVPCGYRGHQFASVTERGEVRGAEELRETRVRVEIQGRAKVWVGLEGRRPIQGSERDLKTRERLGIRDRRKWSRIIKKLSAVLRGGRWKSRKGVVRQLSPA